MHRNIKFLILALMIALATYLMMNHNLGWGIVLCLLGIIPVALYFKNEFILLAFWFIRKQDLPQAQIWLDKIKNYRTQLHPSQYGYYHYLKGLMSAQGQDRSAIITTESYMKKAMQYGLNQKQDQAMANLNLAVGALAANRRQEANKYLEEAKRLDAAEILTDQIKMIKNQMKQPNMQKHVHNPHMRNRGKFF